MAVGKAVGKVVGRVVGKVVCMAGGMVADNTQDRVACTPAGLVYRVEVASGVVAWGDPQVVAWGDPQAAGVVALQ